MEKLYHKGVMKTKIDDCQFVCIAQSDYYRILHQVGTALLLYTLIYGKFEYSSFQMVISAIKNYTNILQFITS